MRKTISLAAAAATATAVTWVLALPTSAQQPPDLIAKHSSTLAADLPDTATSNSGTATLNGFKNWRMGLDNQSATPVTNPTVTLDSGYDPSLFDWNGPVTAFPASMSLPSLAPGGGWGPTTGLTVTSTIPVQFTAGYDSTRTVNTTTIPTGGGQQTLTMTVTPTDPRYEAPDLFGQFIIIASSNLPGVTVASSTGPDNLNQGEQLSTPPPSPVPPGQVFQWNLGGNYGLNIIAPGYPTATQISCSTGTTVNSGTLTDTAGGSGLQYNSSTGIYTYVWKTSKSWAGTCQQFDLRLNDGTDHTADFQFK